MHQPSPVADPLLVSPPNSGAPCSVEGFPGVNVRGPQYEEGTSYSVHRKDARPAKVTLAPGESATSTLTYLEDDRKSPWIPTTVVVTPPGETTSLTAPWTLGSFFNGHSAATHPGDFVSPLVRS